MADNFKYDVFLSHSSQDKAVVRDVAQRLKQDGLRVWRMRSQTRISEMLFVFLQRFVRHCYRSG